MYKVDFLTSKSSKYLFKKLFLVIYGIVWQRIFSLCSPPIVATLQNTWIMMKTFGHIQLQLSYGVCFFVDYFGHLRCSNKWNLAYRFIGNCIYDYNSRRVVWLTLARFTMYFLWIVNFLVSLEKKKSLLIFTLWWWLMLLFFVKVGYKKNENTKQK